MRIAIVLFASWASGATALSCGVGTAHNIESDTCEVVAAVAARVRSIQCVPLSWVVGHFFLYYGLAIGLLVNVHAKSNPLLHNVHPNV